MEVIRLRNRKTKDTLFSSDFEEVVKIGGKFTEVYEGLLYIEKSEHLFAKTQSKNSSN